MQIGGKVGERIPHWPGSGVTIIRDTANGSSSSWAKATVTVVGDATGSDDILSGIIKQIYDTGVGSSNISRINSSVTIVDSSSGNSSVSIPLINLSVVDNASGSSGLVSTPKITDSAVGSFNISDQTAVLVVSGQADGQELVSVGGIKDLLSYNGTIEPGETLVIDAEDLIVELGETNARKYLEGQFPIIYPRSVDIIYSDSEDSRGLEFVIKKKDKHI